MAIRDSWDKFPRWLPFFAVGAAIVSAGIFAMGAALTDQAVGDVVGVIEGDAISVTGPMSIETVRGQVKTIVRSGSDIVVKLGQARIELVEGGQISICGPAHLSVLKSGGSLTLALEKGIIHVHADREPVLTIYTAQIQAQPVAIGDDPRDILVGFESPGAMCIRNSRGAVRLEQQLTGQSVIVPQGGDVALSNGQIDSLGRGTGHCVCELQTVKSAPAPVPPQETSAAPSASEDRNTASDPQPNASSFVAQKSAPKDESVYQVYMPPLRFDANAKVQPEPDPKLLLVIRRVRVRPALVFHGRVEGEPVATAAVTPPSASSAPAAPAKTAPPASDSVFDRVRNFVRKLWSRSS